jgi:hypothetical protein
LASAPSIKWARYFVDDLLERGGFGFFFAPDLLAPPLLRVEPRGPDDGEGLDALGGSVL